MIFAFADFELDEARFELRRSGRPIAVQPKVLRLLLLLVAERHRSLADEELMVALWPNETVGRPSIKRAVMGARIALGDRGQSSIRTVRGHGYQFVLPVELRSGPTEQPAQALLGTGLVDARSSAHFVGREGVLAELESSLDHAASGRGHCVLLFGTPGMGKSSVLHELTGRANSKGARVWLGRCLELDGAPPFWPLQQILREALEGEGGQELRAMLGPLAADLMEGFPELKLSFPSVPPAPDIGSLAARFRLFDSTTRFLVRAAERAPLLVLLDDLQRADQPTLRFLQFLTAQLATARLLVVGTARPSDAREGEAHARLAELARESATRTIVLRGFTPAEIGRYLALRTGQEAPPSWVAQLAEQTGGNPLFLEEILRGLRTHVGPLQEGWQSLHQGEQALGLRGAIERHLQTMPESSLDVLHCAAVLGRELSVALLAETAECAPTRLLPILAAACDAGILQPGEGLGRYRFAHALLRDVLYERTDPLLRAARHARAGLALEARGAAFGEDAELTSMAEHFRLAAPTHDLGKALSYTRRAAERAMQRLAYEEAAAHWGRALSLLDLHAPDQTQRMRLLLAQGEALDLSSDPEGARRALLQAVALARNLGALDVMAQAARLLGRSRNSGTLDVEVLELLREVVGLLSRDDPHMPCLQAMLAKAFTYSSEYAKRAELASSAYQLAMQLREPTLRAESLLAAHDALSDPEYLTQRIEMTTELRRLAQLRGDARTNVYALTTHFQNCVERGDVAGMEMVVSSLAALASQARDPVVRWYEKSYRATRATIDGLYDVAEQYAQQAYQLRKVVGEQLGHHFFCAQVNGPMRIQGRLREAESMASEMTARYPALSGWRAFLGAIYADTGRQQLARELLLQLMDRDLTILRKDPYLLSTLCPVAELCARVGDGASAKLLYDALFPHAHLHGSVSIGAATYGPVSLQLARLAMRMESFDLAELHCREALAEGERMPSLTFITFACAIYAHTLILKGKPHAARARPLLDRAEQLAGSRGMQLVLAHCRYLRQKLAG